MGGFHLIVRAHVDGCRHSACWSGRITVFLKLNALSLNTTRDLKLSRDARIGIEYYVQTSLAFEAGVELIE